MASVNTLCKSVLNVKNTVIKNCNLYSEKNGVKHIRIQARPNKWLENDCPFCHKSCPVYDKHSSRSTIWRGLDWGGILVEVEYQTHRIICPEHGVYVAEVPWAYPGSRFTKDFDLTVAWFASYLPRSTTSYMKSLFLFGRRGDRIFSIVPDRCQILLYEKQGQPEAPARPVSDAEPGGRTGKRSPHLYQGNPALCCH